MASPDATPYIDLVLRDYDPQDLIDIAIADLKTNLPTWVPRDGNVEMVVLEAISMQVAELIYALNRVPSSVVQVLLKLNGVEYDPGEAPKASVRFVLNTTNVTIPAGTSVRLDLPNDADPVTFTVPIETNSPEGAMFVDIETEGDRYTSEANGYPIATDLVLNDSLIFVESVELASAVTGGRDEESDTDYFARGTQLFSRLTNTLILPRQFIAFMLEEVYVERANVLDNYNPATDPENNGPVGTDSGHVTLVAYGSNENLTSAEKTDLYTKVTDSTAANLAVHIIDPTVTVVDISTTIHIEEGFEPEDVINNVRNNLNAFLDPMDWDWKPLVRRNDLISVITNTTGVDYMDALSAPATDFVLTGVATLAKAGDVSVVVDAT